MSTRVYARLYPIMPGSDELLAAKPHRLPPLGVTTCKHNWGLLTLGIPIVSERWLKLPEWRFE